MPPTDVAKTLELRADPSAPPRASSDHGRMRPNLDDVWLALALALPAVLTLMSRLHTVDLAYHLRLGQVIRTTGAIPTRDAFTFTASGDAWVDQQWLAQVALELAYRIGGFAALIALHAAVVTAISAFVFATCRSRGGSARASSLLAAAGFFMAMPYLSLRPQLFGALFFAATVFVIATRGDGRRLWLVPLLAVAWANVHGSFVFAPALVAFALAEDSLTRRAIRSSTVAVFVVTVIATCLTPSGAGVWGYAASLMTNDAIRTSVTEWNAPSMATISGAMFLLGMLGLGAALARRSQKISVTDIAWVAGFSLLALTAYRNILWWAIAVPPVVAAAIGTGARPRDEAHGARAVNVAVLTALAAGLIAALPWLRPDAPRVEQTPPPAIMRHAETTVPSGARVFVFQPWASWVEFARPDVSVFVDSRIELFDAATWRDYRAVAGGSTGWEGVLDRWDVDVVLVSEEQTAVIEGLSGAVGWQTITIEEGGALFTRG
jgi:hypothetical protein